MNIAGQAALVTGAASGLGLAFARRLLERGARVWLLDRDAAALERAHGQLAADYPAASPLLCDVSREDQVNQALTQVGQAVGAVDLLVNNAAVLRDQSLVSKLGKRIKKHSTADWNETLGSNLTGVFLMAREAAAQMIEQRRRGLIVNISSISRAGNPGQTAYAATKAAVDALTVTWSQELAPYGIRVVAIAPGFVETAMTKGIAPLFLERIRERTPLNRYGTLDEFADALEFVVKSDYFNGKILELDGGLRF